MMDISQVRKRNTVYFSAFAIVFVSIICRLFLYSELFRKILNSF